MHFLNRLHYPVYSHTYDATSFDMNHVAVYLSFCFCCDIILIEVCSYKLCQIRFWNSNSTFFTTSSPGLLDGNSSKYLD